MHSSKKQISIKWFLPFLYTFKTIAIYSSILEKKNAGRKGGLDLGLTSYKKTHKMDHKPKGKMQNYKISRK